ncbi:GNAT family acetyltransferase [Pigmentiphaga aceris]|uniref:GNAT family acetyltransferase n=1 Tax=Pigmentiphaga aceris TaxID=1940612 RepID=A0A5C0AWJ3_9BURK|nr:GNAT family acetyltransferase [Pigmentiphaga aceris]QEI05190.1 GNAT family acetyltransferase [Pigmentiphaga aceris]
MSTLSLRSFHPDDESAVIALWHECGLVRPWNDPQRDIARKLTQQPELFLVGTIDEQVVATAMVGYDGHRGWVYYLAVAQAHRKLAIGRTLMDAAEQRLTALGCPKINLMVRTSNEQVLAFYDRLGYKRDDAVSLGKRLIPDGPGPV